MNGSVFDTNGFEKQANGGNIKLRSDTAAPRNGACGGMATRRTFAIVP